MQISLKCDSEINSYEVNNRPNHTLNCSTYHITTLPLLITRSAVVFGLKSATLKIRAPGQLQEMFVTVQHIC